jgi:hypothetical protein
VADSAADASAARRPRRARSDTRRQRAEQLGGGVMDLLPLGERPQPPWHPWPLSELLILVGIVGTVIGFSRGASGKPVLFAGIGSVAIGTLEFSVREHLGGYRSHTILLAFLPTLVVHSVLALTLVALNVAPTASVFAPLAVDVPLFAFLFKLLRGRFLDARSERRLARRH